MTTANGMRSNPRITRLLEDYVGVCNRVLAEHGDEFAYDLAMRFNRRLWGSPRFRTLIYAGHPENIVGEHVLRFDTGGRRVLVEDDDGGAVAFAWRVPVAYLEDVVHQRRDWYLAHPLRLDWSWVTRRLRDEIAGPPEARVLLAGIALGVTIGTIAWLLVARGRRRPG